MVSTLSRSTTLPAWSKVFACPATEFAPTALPLLSGAIPDGLQGSLYRNGPARLERGGQAMGHWFDGDGAILGVHFSENGAIGVYRYVQTAGYQAEAQADALLFGNYGMTPQGFLWQRWRRGFKNAANTSVLALPERLLALWEGGQPHALDLETLETHGLSDLGRLATAQRILRTLRWIPTPGIFITSVLVSASKQHFTSTGVPPKAVSNSRPHISCRTYRSSMIL